MNGRRAACLSIACLLVAAALAVAGCNRGVVYYGDTTPKMEEVRHDYVRNNPGNRFNEDILEGRVHPGMSELQVRVAWGEPHHIAKGNEAGIDQVWTYREDEPSRGESFFQMRFSQGVLYEIGMTRGTPQLTAKDVRGTAYKDEGTPTGGATLTPLK